MHTLNKSAFLLKNGKFVVDTVKESLSHWMQSQSDRLFGDVVEAFEHLFATAQQELKAAFVQHIPVCAGRGGYFVNRITGDLVRGGSTMTVCALVAGKVYVANVGDSLAAVIADAGVVSELGTGETYISKERVKIISANHDPCNAKEMERLKSTRLCPLYEHISAAQKGTPIETGGKGHYHKNVRGDWATVVSPQHDQPFSDTLAMTRSLGDFYLQTLGLLCKPEVFQFTPTGKFAILIATDGVWDNFGFQEIADFIDLERSDHANVSALMEENGARAMRNFGESRDNATAIFFQPALKNA